MKFIKFFIMIIVLSLLYSCNSDTISGDEKTESLNLNKYTPSDTFKAEKSSITQSYKAIGTLRPSTETNIAPQIQAQVEKVYVNSGSAVKRGDILAKLDSRRLKTRLNQAEQALKRAVSSADQAKERVKSAKAVFDQAKSDYKRIKEYFHKDAATKRELEKAESAYLQAEAGFKTAKEMLKSSKSAVKSAKEQVTDAGLAFEYTKIKAPANGEVLKRMIEPGDLTAPGRTVFVLQTSENLRIEGFLNEGLISYVKRGQEVDVSVNSESKDYKGIIEEIVPYADPETRTFLIKASLPEDESLYPGMYGKISIPAEKKEVVLVPEKAVVSVGQLNMAYVKAEEEWIRVYVKTGSVHGGRIEILSGIRQGDIVGIN
ncbi:MAG: efflux RND transporter periplasmic adaptor subunit [Thermodesulfobacteriota bacterium]